LTDIYAGAPTFASEKLAVFVIPVTAAATVYGPPAVELAVNGTDALPEESVTFVMLAVPLLKMPDGPAAGAVNFTVTPWTGFWYASLTVTPNPLGNDLLIPVN